MEITVAETKKLLSLQEEFSGAFHYLKLEFPTANQHAALRGKPLGLNGTTVADVSKSASPKTVTITPTMTITGLKKEFLDSYGLPVQVLRRFGKTWVETTVTDGWTLEEQNKQGERLSGGKA